MSRTCWPYFASLASPTPLIAASSASVRGAWRRSAAASRRGRSRTRARPAPWRVAARQARSCSNTGAAAAGSSAGGRRGGRPGRRARSRARTRSGSRRSSTSRCLASTSRWPRSAPACRSRPRPPAAPGPAAGGRRRATRRRPARCRRRTPSARRGPLSMIRWVFLPSRMSMTWPAPNFWPRSCLSRYTADSSFCAATVPSQVCGGDRQVSQLPHGRRVLAEVGQQLRPGGTRPPRTAPAWRPGARTAAAGARGRPRRCRSSCAAAPRPAGRRPATRWRAARPARPGRSPGSSPRPTWAGPGGRRSARRACRCPCRTRSWPP